MTVQKNAAIGKPQLLTANGSKDTLINQPDQEYNGITIADIAKLVDDPQATPKADAAFVIPSTYRKHDGRSHAAQRENGEYWMLAIDVDEGNPTADLIDYALTGIIGDATRLIYTSSGATADNMKWRVLIPLKTPLTGAEYVDAQLALFDMMDAEFGIKCDTALSRTGQPIYLPNVPADKRDTDGQPNFYIGTKHRGSGTINAKDSRIWANVEFLAKQAEIAERKAAQEREARQARRDEKRSQRGDDIDPVDEFNQRHSIADLLLKYGYEQQGRSDSYRSPQQASGSYATKDFGTHFVSLSGSDAGAGLGQAKDGICWGDAFDLYVFYEHVNNFTNAVREYAKELRPDPFDKINENLPPASDDLDDFDFVPPEGEAEPEPEPKPEPAGLPSEMWPTHVRKINESLLPKRRWVYGHHHIRGFVSVTASAGGIGKTSLTMVEGLAVATGRALLGEDVKERTNVWIINLEDPLEELELRLASASKHYKIQHDEIAGRLFMDGEDTIGMTLAVENRDGIQQNDALLALMRDKIIENNIGLVIIDPFVSVHEVNENSNSAIQVVVAMLRRLARETGAAIHVVHHVRKGNGDDATVDSVRGAGSLIGAARAARVINRVSADDAVKLGIPDIEARGMFRVDDGKANLAPPAEAAVYRRMIGVKLDNDEWVGVAVTYQLPDQWAGMTDRVVNDILTLINTGPEEGEHWSIRVQDKARWAGNVITGYVFQDSANNKSDSQAKSILREWMQNGLIEEIEYRSASQRKDKKGVISTGRVGEMRI